MQGIHTSATVGVGVVVGVGARGGVGLAVAVRPGEAFAGGIGHGVVCAVVDGQVQSVNAGTPVGIGVVVGVSARGGVGLAVAVCPSEAFAGGLGHSVVRAVVDGQMQGIHTSATVGVGVVVGVGARGGVGLAVAVRPGEAFAGGIGHGVVCAVVDGQVQSVNAGTPVGIGVVVGVSARGGVGLAVAVCPSEAFAGSLGHGVVCAVVDGQVQGDRRVCTVDVLILTRVVAGCRIYDAVPLVRFAGGDCKFIRGGVEHRQMQGVNLRTAVVIGMTVLIVAARGVGLSVAVRPSVGVVSSDGVSRVCRVVDRQD